MIKKDNTIKEWQDCDIPINLLQYRIGTDFITICSCKIISREKEGFKILGRDNKHSIFMIDQIGKPQVSTTLIWILCYDDKVSDSWKIVKNKATEQVGKINQSLSNMISKQINLVKIL